jgi:zinc/manganese transport system substrate-binding protein
MERLRSVLVTVVLCAVLALGLGFGAGCSVDGATASTAAPASARFDDPGCHAGDDRAPIAVAAAENMWGSIAAQLGGPRVVVTSIITNPESDPHDYEPTTGDARSVAAARYVIANGLGYDGWFPKLVEANPDDARLSLDVGDALGLSDGDNPHRWYFPGDVRTIVDHITADYTRLEPASGPCFAALHQQFVTTGLARYDDLLARIAQTARARGGVAVGASESIFVGIAHATGLDLVTPPGFLDAISEGADPSAADKATVDRQIDDHEIKVFVYNRQNSTPDVATLVDRAQARGIPVVGITETLTPADATFEAWQADQLQQVLDALAPAGSR